MLGQEGRFCLSYIDIRSAGGAAWLLPGNGTMYGMREGGADDGATTGRTP